MRYTTTIDITELPQIWKNANATRLYFFLAMKCGYHDNDRDLIRISLRTLAASAGVTLSATRHALRILKEAQLIAHDGEYLRVKKFIVDVKPTSRTQKTSAKISADEARQHQQEQEQRRRAYEEVLASAPSSELEQILQRLRADQRVTYKNLPFTPSAATKERVALALDTAEKREILAPLTLEDLLHLQEQVKEHDFMISGKHFTKGRSLDKILIQQAIKAHETT